jgi:hypothetical protein
MRGMGSVRCREFRLDIAGDWAVFDKFHRKFGTTLRQGAQRRRIAVQFF